VASRKVKHARALAKREEFLRTAHEGSSPLDKLKAFQTQLLADQKQKKIEKSKRLAREWRESKKQNGAANA
jgi:hypothetical protein